MSRSVIRKAWRHGRRSVMWHFDATTSTSADDDCNLSGVCLAAAAAASVA